MLINYFIAHKIYKDEENKFTADFSRQAIDTHLHAEQYSAFCQMLADSVLNHPNKIIGKMSKQNNNLYQDLKELILEPLENETGIAENSFAVIAERLTNNLILLLDTQNAKSVGYFIITFLELKDQDTIGIFKISDKHKAYNFENINDIHQLKEFNHLNLRDLNLGCLINLNNLFNDDANTVTMVSALSKTPPNYFINLVGIQDSTNTSQNTSKIQTECNQFFEQNRDYFQNQHISEAQFMTRVDDTLMEIAKASQKPKKQHVDAEDLEIEGFYDTITAVSSAIFAEEPEQIEILDQFLREPERQIAPELPLHKATLEKSTFFKYQHDKIKLTAPIKEVGRQIEIIEIDAQTVQIVIKNVAKSDIENF